MRTRRSQSSSDPVSPQPSLAVGHRTVLLHEAVEQLAIRKDDVVVDATLGGAGHARAIAGKLGASGILIGFDLDPEAIERAHEALKDAKPTVHLICANFRNLGAELEKLGISKVDKILFDLGWSSYQLSAGRGFSFSAQSRSASGGLNEQLLMTYAKNPEPGAITAATIVNEWGQESIADIIFGWGEEHYSRRIAKAIVEDRARKPFTTAAELAETVKRAVPAGYRHGRLHPATRTFQALRIAVNDELGALKDGLAGSWSHLSLGGRIAVISFHSIEDRLVKHTFLDWEKSGEGKRITHSPLRPSLLESRENPRSRSAKLRIIEKTENKE